MRLSASYFSSPVGLLLIEADDKAITSLSFQEIKEKQVHSSSIIEECTRQLEEYFSGKRKSFDVPLAPAGTSFQQGVWNQLQKIPFGKTVSYLQLARELGDEKKIRAAGSANGRNPIAIIIPCHRVIGSDGSLVGYGGGLWKKKWLLEFESGNKQSELF